MLALSTKSSGFKKLLLASAALVMSTQALSTEVPSAFRDNILPAAYGVDSLTKEERAHFLFPFIADFISVENQIATLKLTHGEEDSEEAVFALKNQNAASALYSTTAGLSGAVTPLTKTTVDPETAAALHIPSGELYFAWLYPAYQNDNQDRGILANIASPNVRKLLSNGGFAYFHRNGRLVGLNAFTLDKQAFSFQRYTLNPLEDNTEGQQSAAIQMVLDQLYTKNLFQEVTIPFIKELGAESFAWIHPGQLFDHENNPFAIHGAFAYRSRGDASISEANPAGAQYEVYVLNLAGN